MDLLRQYMVVGGMPQAVAKFVEQLHEPVVLHPKDVKTDKGVLYLPLYMAQLLVVSCCDSP